MSAGPQQTRSRVLVTGATGFVGRAVLARLHAGGYRVRGAARRMPADADPGVDWTVVGEVDGATDWRAALSDVDCVIHLVAKTHVTGPGGDDALAAYRRVNVDGTRRLAEQASAAGVRRLVFASSVKVNGERMTAGAFREDDTPGPEDVYGQTKLEAERTLSDSLAGGPTRFTIVRPPVVYGPGVPANVRALARAVLRGYPLPFARVRNKRSLIAVRNLADALVACAEHPDAADRTFLVSDGLDLSTPDLVRRIAQAAGVRARLLPMPVGVLALGLRACGRAGMADKLLNSLQVDCRRIRRDLGWAPPVDPDAELRAMAADLEARR